MALASGAPVGLLGLSILLVLFGAINAGIIEAAFAPVVYSYFFIIGVLMITFAGVVEFVRSSLFTGTLFLVYGPFFVGYSLFQLLVAAKDVTVAGSISGGLAAFAAVYAVISFLFVVAALRLNLALVALFSCATLTFLTLAGAQSGDGNASAAKASGWFAIVTAILAFYGASSLFLGEVYGSSLLPLWPLDAFWDKNKKASKPLAEAADV